jgi:hypothetical protein
MPEINRIDKIHRLRKFGYTLNKKTYKQVVGSVLKFHQIIKQKYTQ